ncbi:PAS domain-containing hybrid sensor histidine kinase/response regulator [Chryseobacterium sp. A301]
MDANFKPSLVGNNNSNPSPLDLTNLCADPRLETICKATASLTDISACAIVLDMGNTTRTLQSTGLSIEDWDILLNGMLILTKNSIEEGFTRVQIKHNEHEKGPIFKEIQGILISEIHDFNRRTIGWLMLAGTESQVQAENVQITLAEMASIVSDLATQEHNKIQSHYFRTILNVTKNAVVVVDKNFRIKNSNPCFESIFYKADKKELNRDLLDLLQIQNREKFCKEFSAQKSDFQFTAQPVIEGKVLTYEWDITENIEQQEYFCFGKDLTQISEEKKKSSISAKRFDDLFEHAMGLISMHDLEGNILEVNRKGREILNYESSEVRKLNLRDLFPKENHARIAPYLERIKNLKEDTGQMVLVSKEGEHITWLYQNILEHDDRGNAFVLCMAVNMTEHMALEKDLRLTKEMLMQTNEIARVGSWQLDIKSQKLSWSEITKEIHGVSQNYNPTLEQALEFYPMNQREEVEELVKRAIEQHENYDAEVNLVREDGSRIWVRLKGRAVIEEGQSVGIFGVIQDISKEKQIVTELEEKQAMLSSFIRHAPVAIVMLDKELNYLIATERWGQEFGLGSHELIGKNLLEIYPNIPQERKKIYLDATKGITYKEENVRVQLEGKSNAQTFGLIVTPWMYQNKEIAGVMISAQNNTDSVKTSEELKESKVLAERASKAKSEFLANMSHEIRTPLNGVIGFSDLLLQTPLNEIQSQYLKYINESGETLLNLINDILDFSKIESGKMELFIEKFELQSLTSQVINIILYQAQKKNLELLLNIEPTLPHTVFLDVARTKQVLINLLGNALKFTEEGEIELKLEQKEIDDTHLTIRFSVRDSGIGIPIEKQQRIFDAFTQEDSSVSKKYGGTGLGLTISNNILGYMDSHLSLESTLGEGSTFSFDLKVPFIAQHEQPELIEFKSALIVDDNENNRIILQHMLSFKNISSVQASHGMEALQIVMEGAEFDVILMDYHMPILSGVETIEKIKEWYATQNKEMPVVVLQTSSEEHHILTKLQKDRDFLYLLKPIKSDELYSTLRKATQTEIEAETQIIQPIESEPIPDSIAVRILIVDDNPVNMILAQNYTRALYPTAEIKEAVNGLLAVELCEEQKFDIILMDVQMPVMDGIEATMQIRKGVRNGETPIIGVTAGNTVREKQKCLEAGMNEFLPKPLRNTELEKCIQKYLNAAISTDSETKDSTDELPFVDMKKLDLQVADDPEFRDIFLTLVVKELNKALEELKMKDPVIETFGPLLHKLKGTAGTAGLARLAALAHRYDTEFSTGLYDENLIQDLVHEIEQTLIAVVQMQNPK